MLRACIAPSLARPRRGRCCIARGMADAASLAARVRALVPALADERYKGQAGKVGVLGGCREYTGAPFFAAQAAMRVGADLSHVFCTRSAAPVIKSYSPELIVHPYLRDIEELAAAGLWVDVDARHDALETMVDTICEWMPRLDALVVGPGLGRDEAVLSVAERVVRAALQRSLPIVLDGDGLYLVQRDPTLLQGAGSAAKSVVLTPNVNEFRRLRDALNVGTPASVEDSATSVQHMSQRLGGATLVQKGRSDIIAHGSAATLECTAAGAPRRCGGQGDVLAGTTGVFVAWAAAAARRDQTEPDFALAAYAACLVTRTAAARAFEMRKRSMVAGDLLAELGAAVEAIAPCA